MLGGHGRGLTSWLIQRFSALYLFLFSIAALYVWGQQAPFHYDSWLLLWSQPWVQGTSLLALLAILLHAWIGLWTVLTDYVKCSLLRYTLLAGVMAVLAAELLWAFFIIVV